MSEVLSSERIGELLVPFLRGGSLPEIQPSSDLLAKLASYLDLLLRWNARTNLTAIRDPEEIVRRHFGESLFAGRVLSPALAEGATLLDVGSGGGFPGLPIQLLRPDLRVTLAESQGKKAAFLREAARNLNQKTEIFGGRVEAMAPSRTFDVVTLRAVDNMEIAIQLATARVAPGGTLAILGESREGIEPSLRLPIPGRQNSFLELFG